MTATSCPAEKTDLGRKLGPGAVLALGIGTTVGSGIFSSLSEVAGAAGSSPFPMLGLVIFTSISVCGGAGPAGTSLFPMLAFVIGGLLQIPADFCCAELASACLEDGGQYVYFREAARPCYYYMWEKQNRKAA